VVGEVGVAVVEEPQESRLEQVRVREPVHWLRRWAADLEQVELPGLLVPLRRMERAQRRAGSARELPVVRWNLKALELFVLAAGMPVVLERPACSCIPCSRAALQATALMRG
jgi:hypothetical protein